MVLILKIKLKCIATETVAAKAMSAKTGSLGSVAILVAADLP